MTTKKIGRGPDQQNSWREKWESLKNGSGRSYRVSLLPNAGIRPSSTEKYKEIDLTKVAQGLEMIADATGDTIFSGALVVLHSYELQRGGLKSLERASQLIFHGYENPDLSHFKQMKELISRGVAPTIRRAAEQIAVEFWLTDSASFDATVDRLRKGYSRWEKEGCRAEVTGSPKEGDAGYLVLAKPVGRNLKIPMPSDMRGRDIWEWQSHEEAYLPQEGAIVPFTRYWRNFFNDGSISVQKVVSRPWVKIPGKKTKRSV